jgi:hypothetical protein
MNAPRIGRRSLLAAAAVALTMLVCNTAAPAAVEMSTGIRYVIPEGTLSDCSAKAKTALGAFLQTPSESAPGSGEWIAFGSSGLNGPSTAGAVVRCSAIGKGYVVTFTCVVQQPDNLYAADALCLDVAHNFSGKAVTPLPTPTPIPSGCATNSMVGTWVSNDKPGLTFTMDLQGNVTASDGVSGNWGLVGNVVTLTYYGNHTLTLSADGKHASGGGYNLTRKC